MLYQVIIAVIALAIVVPALYFFELDLSDKKTAIILGASFIILLILCAALFHYSPAKARLLAYFGSDLLISIIVFNFFRHRFF